MKQLNFPYVIAIEAYKDVYLCVFHSEVLVWYLTTSEKTSFT